MKGVVQVEVGWALSQAWKMCIFPEGSQLPGAYCFEKVVVTDHIKTEKVANWPQWRAMAEVQGFLDWPAATGASSRISTKRTLSHC